MLILNVLSALSVGCIIHVCIYSFPPVLLCFRCSQAAPSPWEWNRATSRTTRSLLRVSSGPSTWTCSPGSPERPGWTNKARSTLGRRDTATSRSGCRYERVAADSIPVSACGRARSGVCRKRWRSDLIDVFAVWWDADSTLETPPLSSRYHPWKQSVMGSISLFPFEHDSSLDRTPTLPVLEEFSPVVLGGSPASPSLWTAANPFVCVTVNRWLKKSRKGASPSGHLRPSIFYLFITVNRWDWWEPAEFHVHTI